MTIRAVIFDIYKTVLSVGPPPSDRDTRWLALAREIFGASPRLNLAEFSDKCDGVIEREHSRARAVGIQFPEIFWPDVVLEVLPGMRSLAPTARDEFLFRQKALFHTVGLMPGAAEVLRVVRDRGLPAGIASNAQPYTLRELDRALTEGGLSSEIFVPELSFWSFAHGFSKPDPHVFRLLGARLQARGVTPGETLMVGDRRDNDIEPARAQGWQTWRLTSEPEVDGGGDWSALATWIAKCV